MVKITSGLFQESLYVDTDVRGVSTLHTHTHTQRMPACLCLYFPSLHFLFDILNPDSSSLISYFSHKCVVFCLGMLQSENNRRKASAVNTKQFSVEGR